MIAAGAALTAAGMALAQTGGDPVSISLTVKPKVQTADFGTYAVLKGRVTGSPALSAALASKRFELQVEAIAEGYERPVDVAPIVPKADGTFKAKYDIAINSRITLRTRAGGSFTGQSPTVRSLWKPVPEVSNFTRGKKLVMEYRVSIPGGIPFSTGSLKILPGAAKKAYFYAGPAKSIRLLSTGRLRSAYGGERHARLAYPFSKLPPGGGRIYACVKGAAFLGTVPLDPACGGRRSTGVIPPPTP